MHSNESLLLELLYNLSKNELRILREYIDENLAKNFIYFLTFPVGTPIPYVKKKDESLWLYVDYWDLNRITIKNYYHLPLISKALDCLTSAKYYTKLDIYLVYNNICIK